MKRILFLLCTLLIIVGCAKSTVDGITSNSEAEFYAEVECADAIEKTRTYVNENISLRWTAEDKIAIFKETTYMRQYMFTGATGANQGGFRQISVDDEFYYGAKVNYRYAVYPYSDDLQLDETSCAITMNLPSEQTYVPNSFGLGANAMVAVASDSQLMFKNIGSYLRVRLYGDNVSVSSITLSSLGDEAIAGKAEVKAAIDSDPMCTMIGTTKSINLICEEPVKISSSADTPTDFWIVLPPVTFKNGFSVLVESSNGGSQTFKVEKNAPFEKNKYYDFKREVEIVSNTQNNNIPSNQIWYTSSDNNIVTPYKSDCFGAEIISNTYQNGQGIIIFDQAVSKIGTQAFYECTKLESITLPYEVMSIGYQAFKGCFGLLSAKLSDNIRIIDNYAFQACSSLSSIIIPDKVISIGDEAFDCCYDLESVILPLSLTTIGSEAFSSCGSLTEINIPESVISFGDNPFSFTTLKFTGKYASDNGKCLIKDGELVSFGTADGAISYSVPNNVIAIGPSALAATGLQSIIIPESVKTIGKEAFRNNVALKSISIPKSVTSIDQWAFIYCTNLKDIYCYPILPPSLGVDAFYFTGDNKIIHVVESSLTAYKTNWSQYKNIIVGDITE